MRVIPVIDLKDGQVVRGVGGQRAQYRPVQSQLATTAAPGVVARALCDLTRHRHLYIADLDAIAGAAPDWEAYAQIVASEATMTIDAGVATPAEARVLVDFVDQRLAGASLVVALESSSSPHQLQQVFEQIGNRQAVFSLDLKHGRPLTGAAAWQGQSAEEIAGRATAIGFERMIVLDLAAVGVDSGPNVIDLCRAIRARHPTLELVSGVGVRSLDDLRSFHDAGCDGVLVASALHDGRMAREDLENCEFLAD